MNPFIVRLTILEGLSGLVEQLRGWDNILYRMLASIAKGEKVGRSAYYPVWATGLVDAALEKVIRANLTQAGWQREYELDFTVGYGETYYSEFINKLLNDDNRLCEEDMNLPLILAVDIGVGAAFSAWLGQVQYDNRLAVLDYYDDYECLNDLKQDIIDDWGRTIDHLILPSRSE